MLAWLDREFDRMSHMLIEDQPEGDWSDGYESALEMMWRMLGGEE